jgi:hypothetical protein
MNMIIGQIGTPFNIAVVFHLYLLSTDVCIDVHLYFAYLFQAFPAFRAGVRGFRVPPREGECGPAPSLRFSRTQVIPVCFSEVMDLS